MRDTRSTELKPLRDLIIVGNMMAMKVGQDPNNLANTWDEMVDRLRRSGLLEKLGMASIESIESVVMRSFQFAMENPDVARWKSVAVAAGGASVRLAADGRLMQAAMMEGLAEEAKRQEAALLVPA